ncbi:MAG: hypothetical protein CTY31_03575 [Hyphomicrobium sp.]|nr:MAG: hypothetical protein CTY31_03575 [Hyphomicrobium sp.]
MALKAHQRGELLGVFLLLASTAAQMFYLEPLKREIEWRLVTFQIQQTGQVQIRSLYDTQIAMLQSVNAAPERIKAIEADRDKTVAKFTTADANISDYLIEKQRVEEYIQYAVIALFALGILLTALGRANEMRSAGRRE